MWEFVQNEVAVNARMPESETQLHLDFEEFKHSEAIMKCRDFEELKVLTLNLLKLYYGQKRMMIKIKVADFFGQKKEPLNGSS